MRSDDLHEARIAIANFIAETGGDWDWDDYTTVRVKDPYLDAIRRLCLHLPDMFPPEKGSGHYCSPEGSRALQVILDELLTSDTKCGTETRSDTVK